jgi:FtsZ-interacting cell division protein ZipA
VGIRSIDYQTIIPKAPEVQKSKHIETQNPQNNQMINMQKQQEQSLNNLKKVNETKKPYEGKIKRDNPKSKQQQQKKEDEEEQKKNKQNKKQSIDIRV